MKLHGRKKPRCAKCGKFVGRDGYIDVAYDEDGDVPEDVFALCADHVEEGLDRNREMMIDELDFTAS